jgi:hypothetical protein
MLLASVSDLCLIVARCGVSSVLLEFVKPHPDAISAVDEWLAKHGIDVSTAVSRSAALDWVKVTVPVSVAEVLVGAKYNVFRNKVVWFCINLLLEAIY